MFSRNAILCVLLLLVALGLGVKNHAVWFHPAGTAAAIGASTKTDAKAEASQPPIAMKEQAPGESFAAIAEKNIFNPERKEFPVLTVEQQQQVKPIVRPQIILYGVTIGDDFKAASVVNPGRPLYKGERETKTLRVGEQIGDYKLTQILPDRITMEAPGDSFEVLLFDPRSPKRRTELRSAAPPAGITSVSAGGVAGSVPASGTIPAPASPPGLGPTTPQLPSSPAVSRPTPIPPSTAAQAPRAVQPSAPPSTAPATTPQSVANPNIWQGRRAPR